MAENNIFCLVTAVGGLNVMLVENEK
jgi:hypothetical protein